MANKITETIRDYIFANDLSNEDIYNSVFYRAMDINSRYIEIVNDTLQMCRSTVPNLFGILSLGMAIGSEIPEIFLYNAGGGETMRLVGRVISRKVNEERKKVRARVIEKELKSEESIRIIRNITDRQEYGDRR